MWRYIEIYLPLLSFLLFEPLDANTWRRPDDQVDFTAVPAISP